MGKWKVALEAGNKGSWEERVNRACFHVICTDCYINLFDICIKMLGIYFSKNIHLSIFKSVGTYSIPLIPNNLAWWVVNASDRTIIAHFLTTAANGIYSVANKFPNVFISFYNILNLS